MCPESKWKSEKNFRDQEKILKRLKKFRVRRLYSRIDADMMLARLNGESACQPS